MNVKNYLLNNTTRNDRITIVDNYTEIMIIIDEDRSFLEWLSPNLLDKTIDDVVEFGYGRTTIILE